MFSKNRRVEKKPAVIKLQGLDQKAPVDDSDLDKVSLFSRKSFVQRKIQDFLNTLYRQELNSKDGLQGVLTQVINIERKLGKNLPPGKNAADS